MRSFHEISKYILEFAGIIEIFITPRWLNCRGGGVSALTQLTSLEVGLVNAKWHSAAADMRNDQEIKYRDEIQE